MPQFLVSPENISNGTFSIDGDEARHLIKSFRVRVNEQLRLFDGKGRSFTGVITSVGKHSLSGKILSETQSPVSNYYFRLFPSIIQGSRFELLIEKTTEIGVDEIVPVSAERSVIKTGQSGSKPARWAKIITAAAKQSCRSKIPLLGEVTAFSEALALAKTGDLNLIAYEKETEHKLVKLLSDIPPSITINLFIGPEGGFTVEEIELAERHGFKPFTLGQNILRAETAAIAACSILNCLIRS